MTYVVAISNEKGGVAKTTTSLSLGAALAEINHRILLIDLDAQANLTLALGFEPGKMDRVSSNLLLDAAPLLELCYKTSLERLDLLPSNHTMEYAEQVLPSYTDHRTLLRNALDLTRPIPYDFIILDCPPSLGVITFNALAATDILIIPTQAEYFSAYALRNMMNIIRQVRKDINPGLAYRILITMFDQRNRTHRAIYEQLQRAFGEGLLNTAIELDTKLRESPILGLPITEYRPNSRGAIQYRNLAEEVIQYVQEAYTEPA